MDIIKNDDINNSLKNSTRVYLCGNLQFPNELKHVPTTGYELGISEYDFFTFDVIKRPPKMANHQILIHWLVVFLFR